MNTQALTLFSVPTEEMFLSVDERIDRRDSGLVDYVETIAIIRPEYTHLFDQRRTHPDGYAWVRIGRNAKYLPNGKLQWEMYFNNSGQRVDMNERRRDE